MYSVIGNDNREFNSKSAASVAKVAVAWKRNGLQPKAWVCVSNADGLVTTREIGVSTQRMTAKLLTLSGKYLAKAKTLTSVEVAFDRGFAAYNSKTLDNPYGLGTTEHAAWRDGWNQAACDDCEPLLHTAE